MEQWKKIEGYENYKVSNMGRVRNTKTRQYLEGCVNNCGYVKICLSKNNKPKSYQLHRLVAQAFVPNPENKELVMHTDRDNENNNVSNLYWMSHPEFMVWSDLNQRKLSQQKKLI